MTRYSRWFAVSGLLFCYASCSSGTETREGESTAADSAGADSAAAATSAGAPAVQDSALRSAAEGIAAFLRGMASYESLSIADTVELLVPVEGGGTRQRMSREALRDRQAWTVQTNSQEYSFVPAANFAEMRVAPGRHFNCHEGLLSARVPDYAELPHVGVRLVPPKVASCLQVWNATFVFDTTSGQPRLTAAIYDQWEW